MSSREKHLFYDVGVIGAGVVGCAIARELSQYELNVVLIEQENDVGKATSKANTAILHTGFDCTPGSLESQLLRNGYRKLRKYASQVGIAVERLGAVLVAWNTEQLEQLEAIQEKSLANGVSALTSLTKAQVYALEPNLGKGALGGLKIQDESIICPFSPVVAYATEAKLNGVSIQLSTSVDSVKQIDSIHQLECKNEQSPLKVHCRWVVNAAGLFSDKIDQLFGHKRFQVTPRRGELIVFDKLARSLVNHIILPVPTARTKGVLISPTVFGNILLGPTAQDLSDKQDCSTSEQGVASLWKAGHRIIPKLMDEEVTATYAGLRAATENKDYQIHLDKPQRYITVGGIRSTGLSASLGIADYVIEWMAEAGLRLTRKPGIRTVQMPPLGESQLRPYRDETAIANNHNFGKIVCHCERVSLGEIQQSFLSPVPPTDLDGLRRRTRCLQGRCQGFYCLSEIQSQLETRKEVHHAL